MQDYADGIKHVNAIGETVKVVKVDDLGWIKNLSDTVVFDLPNGPGTDELAIAKRLGLWTIIFDDTNSNIPWANVVLNSSILAQSAN